MDQKPVSFLANPWRMFVLWLVGSIGLIVFDKAYNHPYQPVAAAFGTLTATTIVLGITFLIARSRQRKREQATSGQSQAKTGSGQNQTTEPPRMPLDDQQYYDAVAQELQNKDLKPGLWTRAIAETGGEGDQARAVYIKLRVAQLSEEARQQAEAQRQAPFSNPAIQKQIRTNLSGKMTTEVMSCNCGYHGRMARKKRGHLGIYVLLQLLCCFFVFPILAFMLGSQDSFANPGTGKDLLTLVLASVPALIYLMATFGSKAICPNCDGVVKNRA